jgi:hypothetical protein
MCTQNSNELHWPILVSMLSCVVFEHKAECERECSNAYFSEYSVYTRFKIAFAEDVDRISEIRFWLYVKVNVDIQSKVDSRII